MFPILKVGNEHAAKAGMSSQIGLVPPALLPQFANPLTERDADIVVCHPLIMHVLFRLRVA
ncbi:MAG TPA: hypothetical protein VG649_14345 [Candidatus Angelobacter sp.]|nr:hypothetical protein [Candidatus Angelobacter sp.]